MFVVHGTKKFRDRVAQPRSLTPAEDQTRSSLGAWYATVLFWQPQVALFVNETTRLPLLVRFAPAATVVDRMPANAGSAFRALGLSDAFIERELAHMHDYQLVKTNNRSVLGTMNDFAYLAEATRTDNDPPDLLELSLRLARTPCGPPYKRHISPDRELLSYIADQTR